MARSTDCDDWKDPGIQCAVRTARDRRMRKDGSAGTN